MNTYLLVLLFARGVFAAGTDEMTVEVMEGNPVTLKTSDDKNVCYENDTVEWTFGADGAVIARNGLIYNTDDERFIDRLSLNPQTGDLTIRNTRVKHTGLYELKITGRSVHKKFNVIVLDAIPIKVSKTEGESVTLSHDIPDIQKYDWIKWMFEKTIIAEFDKRKNLPPSYHRDVLEGRFRDRLKLDVQTGSLTITNIRKEDAGLYQLQVIVTNKTTNRMCRLTVSAPGLSAGYIVLICGCVLILILLIGGIFYCLKKSKSPMPI